jgi:hypothetical protein
MDDEEDPWVDWLLPDRWAAVIGLIVAICVGFWQVFVIVADHQRGQPGDARGYGQPCRASTSDAAGCGLPAGDAD